MKRKKTELSAVSEPETAEAPRSSGKFRAVLGKIGKRNIIIAVAVLLIGAAVWLNWLLFSGGSNTTDGYGGYDKPSGTVAEDTAKPSENTVDAYFSATQVSRQRARDEALEVLQSVVDNAESDDGTRQSALTGIASIAEEIRKEADMESLITAKGFEQCVAVLNGDTVSIIVKSDTLQPAQIAQINEIVYASTGISPSGVTIIRK